MGVVAKMTVEKAARSLNIKGESVRKRLRGAKRRAEKGPDGRLYLYVEGTDVDRDGNVDESQGLYGDRSRDEPADAAREVMETKDETIRIL